MGMKKTVSIVVICSLLGNTLLYADRFEGYDCIKCDIGNLKQTRDNGNQTLIPLPDGKGITPATREEVGTCAEFGRSNTENENGISGAEAKLLELGGCTHSDSLERREECVKWSLQNVLPYITCLTPWGGLIWGPPTAILAVNGWTWAVVALLKKYKSLRPEHFICAKTFFTDKKMNKKCVDSLESEECKENRKRNMLDWLEFQQGPDSDYKKNRHKSFSVFRAGFIKTFRRRDKLSPEDLNAIDCEKTLNDWREEILHIN